MGKHTTPRYVELSLIMKRFEFITKDDKVETLRVALDFLDKNRDKSPSQCIALAMGYENKEGGTNTWYKVI